MPDPRRAVVALSALALLTSLSCGPPQTRKVTVGIQVSPAMTLVMVAKDLGLFANEGLDVELKEFTAGKFALQAFLSGAVDYAVSGEVPVALAVLQGNQTRVVTQVVERTVNEVRVIARRDPSLTAPGPKAYFRSKRRKLATSFGGGPEFYTYNFLKHYGIAAKDVEIVSQKPEDMPAALSTGSVDAVAIFEPFAFFAETRSGGHAISFSDPTLYSEFYVLNARPEQIDKSPETVEGMVRALVKAGDAIAADPEKAKQIAQKYTRLERPVIDGIWANFVFRPALTEQLVKVWEREAAWARESGKIGGQAPAFNFHGIVDPRFLKKVRPEAILTGEN